jgi:hypothetical protein
MITRRGEHRHGVGGAKGGFDGCVFPPHADLRQIFAYPVTYTTAR